jgi:hypothetical protein
MQAREAPTNDRRTRQRRKAEERSLEMTKTRITKTAVTIALITAFCLMVSAQGLSEAEAQKEREVLAYHYNQLVLKLFPRNVDGRVVISQLPVPREMDYSLVVVHYLYSDSMTPVYREELDKIAEWIENNRDNLKRWGICEVGLSGTQKGPYRLQGKSSFVRNKDGEWEFKAER